MTGETCGPAWWSSFVFLTSLNRGRGPGPLGTPPGSDTFVTIHVYEQD